MGPACCQQLVVLLLMTTLSPRRRKEEEEARKISELEEAHLQQEEKYSSLQVGGWGAWTLCHAAPPQRSSPPWVMPAAHDC
jgi:hypothetical protein